MKVQDVATLLIGAAALILSVVTAVTAWVHQRHETEQNLRQQLTDVINKLGDVDSQQIDVAAQAAKLASSFPAAQVAQVAPFAPAFPSAQALEAAARMNEVNARNGELNQLRAALAGQASFLMDGIESRVTAVECNTVAQAFARTGNVPKADRYFRLSIEKSKSQDKDQFLQALATRGYAAFLYGSLNDPTNGSEQFRQACALLAGDEDYLLAATVPTLQMWAYYETMSGSTDSALQHSKDALDTFQKIKNPMFKELARTSFPMGNLPQPSPVGSAPGPLHAHTD